MITHHSVLVQLVRLVDRLPAPSPATTPRRGRPIVYSDALFLKALVIMIVRRLHKVGELLAVLEEPNNNGRFPSRRTFERRLRALPDTMPEKIGCLGRHLVELLKPWAYSGRAVALDSTVLSAKGGVWHNKDKEAGVVPHSSIDTEAGWTYSGWHGWVYGWKLHLACTVAGVWMPLAARLTPANVSDGRIAPLLIEVLPEEARFVLGDKHYDAKALKEGCLRDGRFLVSPKRGQYPHTDEGVEVRRIFHLLRHRAIENLNGHFKALFDAYGSVPTKGRVDTARFALGAVFVYQLALLHRHDERRLETNRGLEAFLRVA
ncbi:MAG: transposase [Actinomycetota bacterium]|nr:transposase [Actinomycetota bacterium]